MPPKQTELEFNFPLATLQREGNLIIEALEDHATELAERTAARGPTFVTDVRSVWTILFGDSTSPVPAPGKAAQAQAKLGEQTKLTKAQERALKVLQTRIQEARETAKEAFPKDKTKLHAEFRVGVNTPDDLDGVLGRARIILGSCRGVANAAALARQGRIEADNVRLETAIKGLEDADKEKEGAMEARVKSTGDRNADANRLYESLKAIQNMANLEWPEDVEDDPETQNGNREKRGLFRLDDFPPAGGAKPAKKTAVTKPA